MDTKQYDNKLTKSNDNNQLLDNNELVFREVRILKNEIIQIRELLGIMNENIVKIAGKGLLRSSSSKNVLQYANEKYIVDKPVSPTTLKRRLTDTSIKYPSAPLGAPNLSLSSKF